MTKIKITQEMGVFQYLVQSMLPLNCFHCLPEITFTPERDMFYFTYPLCVSTAWMSVKKYAEGKGVKFSRGYHREVLPFAFYALKSESKRPVEYVTNDTKELLNDFASYEKWPNPIPRCMEHRELHGGYARGFKPTYVGVNDWLVLSKGQHSVYTDEEFQKLKG